MGAPRDLVWKLVAATGTPVRCPQVELFDELGRRIGHVDRQEIARGEVRIEGWALGEEVRLAGTGAAARTRPGLPREDVARALGRQALCSGFALTVPHADAPIHVVVASGHCRYVYRLAPPSRRALAGATLRALARLPASALCRLLRAGPARAPGAGRIDPRVLAPARHAAPPRPAEVTIVMPVHNAFDVLRQALARIEANTDLPWHLVLIEDGSTDPRVRPWLRAWAARQGRPRVTLLENARNLGFVRSVNRGLAAALGRGAHVVLLNSDALVPPGWAGRLIAPILQDDRVASVTPMSNDAELQSVPHVCTAAPLKAAAVDAIDAAARRLSPAAAQVRVPTGVGFCMAMNIAWLRRLPRLDPAFGRGYGEEVDWCRRAVALGARHVAHGGVFVGHGGAQSFGKAEKARLLRESGAILARRYPRFDGEVRDFLGRDPLLTVRLALGLASAGAAAGGRAVPLYLAHSLGGGAERYLRRRLTKDIARLGAAVVVRVGGAVRWQVELKTAEGETVAGTNDSAALLRLLRHLPRRHVIYGCGVGDGDALELPALLMRLSGGARHRLEVLFHDYFPLTPSYTLLDAGGAYRGVPGPDDADPAHRFRRPDGSAVALSRWREAWGGLLARADEIVAFSHAARKIVASAYPEQGARILVRPHAPLCRISPVIPGPQRAGRAVIGVLGDIGHHKGAGVLCKLSEELARTGAARLVVIGQVDPAYRLAPPARVHGAYEPEEISALAARYGIDRWFIPSIWPETFSYTTHEALATRLPVWVFDLGAQAEAVAGALRRGRGGGIIPPGTPAHRIADMLTQPVLPGACAA